MSFTTHASMIVRLNNPESKAWKSFFDFYAQLIRLHGKDCGVKEENLDDLIQDVMIAVSRKTPSFNYDRDKGRFRDYLKKIIRAKAVDTLRGYYRRESCLLHLPDTTKVDMVLDEALPPDQALDRDFSHEWKNDFMKQCLQTLKTSVNPKHYQIFFMLEFRKLPVARVAAFSGLSYVTIYSIRARLESKLAQIARNLAAKMGVDEIKLKVK